MLTISQNVTAKNRTELLARKAAALAPIPDFGPRFGPCSAVHPMSDLCGLSDKIPRWFIVFRWMLPLYGALHFVPMILFKRNVVLRAPLKMFIKAALGSARSSAFLACFVLIYQSKFTLPSLANLG